MWNPFSKDFGSGYSKGFVPSSDTAAPAGAKYFYQREHGGGLPGAGTKKYYFDNEDDWNAFFKVDQAAYRTKYQFITIGVVLAAVAAWWYFKRK
jgi:hypothetical protein